MIFPESYPFSLVAHLPNTSKKFNGAYHGEGQILFSPAQGETAVTFLVLVLSCTKKHLLDFFASIFEIEGRDNFAALLMQFFEVASSILDNDAWPSNWLNVNILAHKVLIKMMESVAVFLEKDFIPGPDETFQFNVDLWRDGIHMLLKLLSSDQLVIEEFSPQVRNLTILSIEYAFMLFGQIETPSRVAACWRHTRRWSSNLTTALGCPWLV